MLLLKLMRDFVCLEPTVLPFGYKYVDLDYRHLATPDAVQTIHQV